MSENLRKTIGDLMFVASIKCPKTKRIILNYLSKSPKYFLALKEISENIIKGNSLLKSKKKLFKKKLASKDKINIYNIYKAKKSSKNRKKLVNQSGGWLWIVPLVSSILDLINVSLSKS